MWILDFIRHPSFVIRHCMKPPPFLLGAALAFWGWQSGLLIPGVAMALIVEAAQFTKARWEFSDEDFSRVWTFCSLLFLAAGVYAFTSNEGPSAFGNFFSNPAGNARTAGASSQRTAAAMSRWLPMIFFPFLAVQLFSTRGTIPLTTISFLLRRRQRKAKRAGKPVPPGRDVNIAFPFLALTLLAAGVHPAEDRSFFWGLSVLLAWTLWSQRSRRFGLTVWVGAVAAAMALGYASQFGIGQLQRLLEQFNPSWFMRGARRAVDPEETRTALGQVGEVKTSGRIVIRLTPKAGSPAPTYLREASYRTYKMPAWSAGSSRDAPETVPEVPPESGQWDLLAGRTNVHAVSIACFLESWKNSSPAGLLPLPAGSGRLQKLRAYLLTKNTAGAVFAEGPGLVVFDALYGPGVRIDSPPGTGSTNTIPTLQRYGASRGTETNEPPPPVNEPDGTNEDRHIPESEESALEAVIAELNLRGRPRDEVLRTLAGFFADQFTYRTWQPPARMTTNETSVGRFLRETRAGHCEYFATATTLLLRRLEIPARYAVGYAVHETSGRGYVVRLRDAHAWCLVWNKETQVWDDFDTTPASWVKEEGKRASAFQWLADVWGRLGYEFAKLRWGQTNLRQYLLVAIIPALGLLFYQIVFRRGRRKQKTVASTRVEVFNWPGLDSEFYILEKQLADRGVPRGIGEPLNEWLARVTTTPGLRELCAPLQEILRLHYRYRFDPVGLSEADRDVLRREVMVCLESLIHVEMAGDRKPLMRL